MKLVQGNYLHNASVPSLQYNTTTNMEQLITEPQAQMITFHLKKKNYFFYKVQESLLLISKELKW